MIKTFGQRVTEREEGMLRPIHFTRATTMDQRTGDGRMLHSAGGGTRELPITLQGKWVDGPGHEGAVPIGRIDQIAFHDDGRVEEWGWLIDDENGRTAATYVRTKVMRTSSTDLADVEAEMNIDLEKMALLIDMKKWNIIAHTIVSKPAFNLTESDLDEITASWTPGDEMLECEFDEYVISNWEPPSELAASLATAPVVMPYDDFFIPESDKPHKIIVDADGRVYGHLAEWGKPHRGIIDRLVTAPRPRDGYASFNHPGPLTERGQVGTGPIFLVGGHGKRSLVGLTREEIDDALGGVENAWADVRVTEGRHGPWVSGRVRPGVSEEMIHAARCSHISGHWLGDKLVAIPSVNVPAFEPGLGFSAFASLDANGDVLELVASFRPTERPDPDDVLAEKISEKTADKLWVRLGGGIVTNAQPITFTLPATATGVAEATVTPGPIEDDGTVPLSVDLDLLAVELSLDD